MTQKTFSVVGITEHGNTTKVRFTDDLVRRVKQFSKGGATRVDFIELPEKMNKIDALRYMLTRKEFMSGDDQALIEDTIEDKERELRKGQVKIKATPDLSSIASRPRQEVTAQDVLDLLN